MEEKKYKDPNVLQHLYWDKKMNQKEMGEELGVSASTISKYMRENDIETRDPAKMLKGEYEKEELKTETGKEVKAIIDDLEERYSQPPTRPKPSEESSKNDSYIFWVVLLIISYIIYSYI